MAETGPFIIDGRELRTDRDGNVTSTAPAVAAEIRPVEKLMIERMRARRQTELDALIEQRDDINLEITRLQGEVRDLATIIANASDIGVIP